MAYRSKTPRARQNPLSAVEKRRQRQSSRTITVPEIPGIPSDPNNPTSMNVIQTSAAQGDCAYLLWGGGLGTAGAPIGPNIELHINPPQVGQYANIDQAKFEASFGGPIKNCSLAMSFSGSYGSNSPYLSLAPFNFHGVRFVGKAIISKSSGDQVRCIFELKNITPSAIVAVDYESRTKACNIIYSEFNRPADTLFYYANSVVYGQWGIDPARSTPYPNNFEVGDRITIQGIDIETRPGVIQSSSCDGFFGEDQDRDGQPDSLPSVPYTSSSATGQLSTSTSSEQKIFSIG